MKKIMSHPSFKAALQPYNGDKWLFDGKKLAWAPVLVNKGELRFKVDLDDGKRPPASGQGSRRSSNDFHITIRNTTEIKVDSLQGYLEHKTSFNTSVQEALNFLDHLIRQWPSQHMVAIKRNFYHPNGQGIPIGNNGVIEVHKGTYASIRMSHNLGLNSVGLGYNVDVANTCFWVGRQSMDTLVCSFLATCDARWNGLDPIRAYDHLRPVRTKAGRWESSDAFKQLRKLRRLKFTIRHRNRRDDDKIYTVQDFLFDEKFGGDGATARNKSFTVDGAEVTVYNHYLKKHGVTLRYSNLPLIDAGKAGFIPMELAYIEPMQRYPFKLNPEQTAAMIKIAVTRPGVRKNDIMRNVGNLQIPTDPFLQEYGVQFQQQFAVTDARILAPPPVKFSQGTADPKFSGRWDLRGKKFWKQNIAPLQSWGIIALERSVEKSALTAFMDTFKSTFMGHGGKCTAAPRILNTPNDMRYNPAAAIQWAHEEITKTNGYTQILFVVLDRKNAGNYERLKKSADCRFGILTQVVLHSHVKSNNGQYHSNVCMKVNAKLGGATSCTPPPVKSPTYFPANRPTMLIGVDVSHAAPGGNSPSTAAMTMSVDRDGVRYAAVVETNGYRTEMLTEGNIQKMFGQLAGYWRAGHNNSPPAHVIYFRDGVGEGQFAQVMDCEIRVIREFLNSKGIRPKFTVIVATKRHHIRFFPEKGDKFGNALPGTLVEKEVTHPFMFDFYLCSHVAIQGTSRPVHYHVIMDEANLSANDLQRMIYHQCYSYARSTTPVSLHPAVYYAHLASNRARAHENIATSEGFRSGPKGHEMIRDKVAKGQSIGSVGPNMAAPPLLRLGGSPENGRAIAGEERQREFIRGTMWYI